MPGYKLLNTALALVLVCSNKTKIHARNSKAKKVERNIHAVAFLGVCEGFHEDDESVHETQEGFHEIWEELHEKRKAIV